MCNNIICIRDYIIVRSAARPQFIRLRHFPPTILASLNFEPDGCLMVASQSMLVDE